MNQTLTRRLAVAQTTVQLLDSVSSVLNDLADLQAHRAFRARVMEFIAAKHAEGECPADPLSACRPVVERAAAALDAARAQAEAWAAIDLPEGDRWALRIGRVEIDDVLSRAREALRSLGDTAARLAAGFDAREWAGGDLDGELLRLAGILYPPDHLLSAASTDDRRGLFALATQASGVRENVVGHLRRVEAEALQLIAAHDSESAALREALAAAEVGNHLTARRIAGGLRGSFTDLDYGQVENVCRALFAGAGEIEGRWRDVMDARAKLPVGADGAWIRDFQGRLDVILKLAAGRGARGGAPPGTEAFSEIDGRVRAVVTEARALRDSLDRAGGGPAFWFKVWVMSILAGVLAGVGSFELLTRWGLPLSGGALAAAIGIGFSLVVVVLILVGSCGLRLTLPQTLSQPRVYLDGVPADMSRLPVVPAVPGAHRVEVYAGGRQIGSWEVNVPFIGRPDLTVGDTGFRLTLSPTLFRPRVCVDGVPVDMSGLPFVHVCPGTHRVEVDAVGRDIGYWEVNVPSLGWSDLTVQDLRVQSGYRVNTLGIIFVWIQETSLWWAIWPTRVSDYNIFTVETRRSCEKPNFEQGDDHPAVNVSWEDAQAFCAWLTEKEMREERISPGERYRLPTDHEWSCAVGIGDREDPNATPASKAGKIEGVYPWGTRWPPPKNAGNYGEDLGVDSFEYTAPVGSFPANVFGLFDLGGNVWEWCEDPYESDSEYRVVRGASCSNFDLESDLWSSSRGGFSAGLRSATFGFRCVLSASGSSASRLDATIGAIRVGHAGLPGRAKRTPETRKTIGAISRASCPVADRRDTRVTCFRGLALPSGSRL